MAVEQIEVVIAALKRLRAGTKTKREASLPALQVVELFPIFSSSTIWWSLWEVIHMDAAGVQVALEAHFADWSAATTARFCSARIGPPSSSRRSLFVLAPASASPSSTPTHFDTTLRESHRHRLQKEVVTTEEGAEKVLGPVEHARASSNCLWATIRRRTVSARAALRPAASCTRTRSVIPPITVGAAHPILPGSARHGMHEHDGPRNGPPLGLRHPGRGRLTRGLLHHGAVRRHSSLPARWDVRRAGNETPGCFMACKSDAECRMKRVTCANSS